MRLYPGFIFRDGDQSLSDPVTDIIFDYVFAEEHGQEHAYAWHH
jgi:hypothetical protein